MSKIKVIIKRPDEPVGHVTTIAPTLENLQKLVDGYIETVTIGTVVIICNEEGRIRGLPYNCTVFGRGFVGTIVIAGTDGDEFGSVPISFNVWKTLLKEGEEACRETILILRK